MAIIPQKSLFSWEDVDNLGDLQRLKYVIDSLPDESLMRKLEKERGNGRDDYPVRATWNSLMAMIVFEHNGVESLRRELGRNGQLRIFADSILSSSTLFLRPVPILDSHLHL